MYFLQFLANAGAFAATQAARPSLRGRMADGRLAPERLWGYIPRNGEFPCLASKCENNEYRAKACPGFEDIFDVDADVQIGTGRYDGLRYASMVQLRQSGSGSGEAERNCGELWQLKRTPGGQHEYFMVAAWYEGLHRNAAQELCGGVGDCELLAIPETSAEDFCDGSNFCSISNDWVVRGQQPPLSGADRYPVGVALYSDDDLHPEGCSDTGTPASDAVVAVELDGTFGDVHKSMEPILGDPCGELYTLKRLTPDGKTLTREVHVAGLERQTNDRQKSGLWGLKIPKLVCERFLIDAEGSGLCPADAEIDLRVGISDKIHLPPPVTTSAPATTSSASTDTAPSTTPSTIPTTIPTTTRATTDAGNSTETDDGWQPWWKSNAAPEGGVLIVVLVAFLTVPWMI